MRRADESRQKADMEETRRDADATRGKNGEPPSPSTVLTDQHIDAPLPPFAPSLSLAPRPSSGVAVAIGNTQTDFDT